ncbi:type 1 phosphatases regulator YPI1, partial [Herrania umbratica]|uniref:Type 1 phosphatases regulator YPI1 n=1 Tax=Herrania umbratica TaxID=108875 RepID=A0A6J1AZ85_9ROSI
MARPTATSTTGRPSSTTSSVTTTVTIDNSGASSQPQETLVLELRPRKKKVTWKKGTVDNEFMNKKSSKICCVFHKEKPFADD